MTRHDADQVAAWRYDGRWSVYDLPTDRPFLDDLADCFAVTEDERLVGFCCIGDAARIPGLVPQPDTVDVGLGMDPELVGHGRGFAFGEAVLAYLATAHPDNRFRAVVQAWNERSRRLTGRLGFEDAGGLTVIQDGKPVDYRIMKRRK